jgi:CcmD family protein
MTWVFAAFAAVWIAVFIFLMRIGRAQQVLSQEIAALRSSKRQVP